MTADTMKLGAAQAVPPWYRQFWPWFIMSIPAATVVACMYTISLALSTSDSLVLKPVNGIDVLTEQHLLAEKRAVALGMNASITLQRDLGIVTMTVSALPEADRMQVVALQFSHPTASGRDRQILLSPGDTSNGVTTFTGRTDEALTGRWYLVLEQADAWRLTGVWTGGTVASLAPRGAE